MVIYRSCPASAIAFPKRGIESVLFRLTAAETSPASSNQPAQISHRSAADANRSNRKATFEMKSIIKTGIIA